MWWSAATLITSIVEICIQQLGRAEQMVWLPYDAGLSMAAETLLGVLKRVIVSPVVYRDITTEILLHLVSSGGGRGWRGHAPPATLTREWHLEGRKYGILKFGHFVQIAICIADSYIFIPSIPPNTSTVLGPRPKLSVVHNSTQSSVYTKKLTLMAWLINYLL